MYSKMKFIINKCLKKIEKVEYVEFIFLTTVRMLFSLKIIDISIYCIIYSNFLFVI
jgi:hypothetical protein